jgi:hypothetical protein
MVSLFQALVLLLFNNSDELSLEELRTFTNIEVKLTNCSFDLCYMVSQYELPVVIIDKILEDL